MGTLLCGGGGDPNERGVDLHGLLVLAVLDDVVAELVADLLEAPSVLAVALADLVSGGVAPALRARLRRLVSQPLGVRQARLRGPGGGRQGHRRPPRRRTKKGRPVDGLSKESGQVSMGTEP